MKVLLLDPHNDAMRSMATPLQAKGLIPLLCSNPQEAWQMLELHGESVELAILFREDAKGKGEPGLEFIKKFKAEPRHADLPYILVSEVWGDQDFVKHQATPVGANAYWKWPKTTSVDLQGLYDLIEAVTGQALGMKAPKMSEDYTHVTSLTKQVPSTPPPPPVGLESSLPPPPPVSSNQEVYELALEVIEPDPEPSVFTDSFEVEISDLNAAPPSPPIPMPEPPAPEPIKEFEDQIAGAVVEKVEKPKFQPEFESEPAPAPIDLGSEKESASAPQISQSFLQPVDDAMIPGGVTQSPDMATIKKYLGLREQDVASLSHQLRTARSRMETLEQSLRETELKKSEMEHQVNVLKERLEERDSGRSVQVVSLEKEVDELRFQVKAKSDKARLLEQKVVDATKEIESLKERVRGDIRKIRLHEKELENRLEIMKRDSEALLVSRENRILDLKRKLDLLEFNMDLLQDKYLKEQEKNLELEKRLDKAAQAMRLAGGFLGEDEIEKASGQ